MAIVPKDARLDLDPESRRALQYDDLLEAVAAWGLEHVDGTEIRIVPSDDA